MTKTREERISNLVNGATYGDCFTLDKILGEIDRIVACFKCQLRGECALIRDLRKGYEKYWDTPPILSNKP